MDVIRIEVTSFDGSPGRDQKTLPILIELLLDGSPSMDEVKEALALSIGQDFVDALQGVNKQEKSVVRIHADVFSSKMVPLWKRYKGLWEIGSNPVREEQLYDPAIEECTALYRSTINAYNSLMASSMQMHQNMNKGVKAKLIVLTDGANNEEPEGAAGEAMVNAVFSKVYKPVIAETILVYFKTTEGLDKRAFGKAAAKCGFDQTFFFDEHSTDKASLRREIRRVLGILSRTRAIRNAPVDATVQVFTKNELLKW